MTQEVLKLALECAERCDHIDGMYNWIDTITAIKEALKEHAMREVQRLGQEIEQEPVAKARFDGTLHWLEPYGIGLHRFQGLLYTHPPQRTWVGLTNEELTDLFYNINLGQQSAVSQAIALLKEKNT
jgi:hypothetical protein